MIFLLNNGVKITSPIFSAVHLMLLITVRSYALNHTTSKQYLVEACVIVYSTSLSLASYNSHKSYLRLSCAVQCKLDLFGVWVVAVWDKLRMRKINKQQRTTCIVQLALLLSLSLCLSLSLTHTHTHTHTDDPPSPVCTLNCWFIELCSTQISVRSVTLTIGRCNCDVEELNSSLYQQWRYLIINRKLLSEINCNNEMW